MPNNESVDIFGRRRRHPEKRIDCAAKPVARRRKRRPSVRAMIREAEKAGAKVTVAADGSVTLQFGNDVKPNGSAAASLDLDRELEEFEARHGQA
jgi:hypothetical protein